MVRYAFLINCCTYDAIGTLNKGLSEISDDLDKISSLAKRYPFLSKYLKSFFPGRAVIRPPFEILSTDPNEVLKTYSYLNTIGQVTQDLIEKVVTSQRILSASSLNDAQKANTRVALEDKVSEVDCNIFAEDLLLKELHKKLLKIKQKIIWLQTVVMPLLVAWAFSESISKNSLAFWRNLTRFLDRLLLLTGYSLTGFLGQCLSPFDKSWTSDLNGLHRQMIQQGKPNWAVLLLVPLHFSGILFGGLQIALDELLNSEEELLAQFV